MIQSKSDYKFYLEADKIALNCTWKDSLFNKIWRFEKLLRKYEYYLNCKKSIIWRPYIFYLQYRYSRLGIKLGFTIPPNVFGPGLSLAHYGTIVISHYAKVGENCRLHVCVNIGTKSKSLNLAPQIGDNVYIGPGAKLFGDIKIADGIAIGANSVVNKSFLEQNITIAGIPAKKVSEKGSEGQLIKGTDLAQAITKY
jgi:serine O-acetyltransferase